MCILQRALDTELRHKTLCCVFFVSESCSYLLHACWYEWCKVTLYAGSTLLLWHIHNGFFLSYFFVCLALEQWLFFIICIMHGNHL